MLLKIDYFKVLTFLCTVYEVEAGHRPINISGGPLAYTYRFQVGLTLVEAH